MVSFEVSNELLIGHDDVVINDVDKLSNEVLVVYLVESVVMHGAVASVNLDNLLVVVLGVGEQLIVVRNVLAFSGAESGVEQDSVVHSYASFHFTILIDVLLMSSIPFLDLGTRYESLIVMTTMYGVTFKIHYLAVYYI